jgi:signal transduction histidine kinase
MRLEPGASADQATETALFYVCSEALANSLKHSGARNVEVTLRSGDPIVLTVTDDGTGGADPEGPGLTGLRDRVGALGGALLVENAAAGGTRVKAQLPRHGPEGVSRSGRKASGPSRSD